MSELKKIFDKYGADKSSKHKYHEIYEPLWEPLRDKEINILEVGIWKGFGMQAFLDYFPKAQVYGIDIFTRIRPEEVEALKNPRAHYVEGDSTNPAIRSVLQDKFDVEFDIILDDGAHFPKANQLTMEHLIPLLKDDGMYIIEDVWPLERMSDKELGHAWLQRWPDRYNHITNNEFVRSLVNTGLEIKRYDNRKVSKQPDSYVITLTPYK